jgi:hypothetical protein
LPTLGEVCAVNFHGVAIAETAKTDEHGRAMHEECYLLKARREEATTLSLFRKSM